MGCPPLPLALKSTKPAPTWEGGEPAEGQLQELPVLSVCSSSQARPAQLCQTQALQSDSDTDSGITPPAFSPEVLMQLRLG